MRYYAQIGDREYEIQVENGQVWVDGRSMEVDLHQVGTPELYSVLVNGRSYEILVEEARQGYVVTLQGEQYVVQVEDERTRRMNLGRRMTAAPKGELLVKAPIPGLVVKVLVKEGEQVVEDQPLIILEAMKMENEIRALRGGVVRRVEVSPGQRVEQDAPLLLIG